MEFPGLENHGILVKVIESHGKAICFEIIKRSIKSLLERDSLANSATKAHYLFYRSSFLHDIGLFCIKCALHTIP